MIALENATPELIQKIAARDDVRKIIANPSVKQDFQKPKSKLRIEGVEGVGENIVSTGAVRVWNELNVKGRGIVIAGQDTGVQWDHPALATQYRGFSKGGVDHAYNWHDAIHKGITPGKNPCGFNSNIPCDDDQHGTHTMGTVIGDDGAENKIGMAPESQWMACRNMDRGTGRPTTYIECFEYFLAPYRFGENSMTDGDPVKAPHVINNSWGCPPEEGCEGSEMIGVLEAMAKAGIMVVVSAGNAGPDCETINDQPATITEFTLSVGAHNHRNGKIADFSSRGPSKLDGGLGPDLTAPGVAVRSAIPGNKYDGSFWSGTSMAGPHVVGAVALL